MSGISGKKPTVLRARAGAVPLTEEERFLIARIDGQLSIEELVAVTGLHPERVERIVSKLASDGVVDLVPSTPTLPDPDDDGTTSLADLAAAVGMDPSVFIESVETTAPESARDTCRELPYAEEAREKASRLEVVANEALDQLEDDGTDPLAAEGRSEPGDEEGEVTAVVAERNYRQVYEARWHSLPVDARVGGAKSATGADLFALCFDADPRVIAAILENAMTGLDHVRMIAFHHRTNAGLEILARRHDWLRDTLVERRLLRNPMIGEIVLGRVMGSKPLFSTYKIAIDRDVPEVSRIKCRGMVRQKWATAPSEDRADLLRRTDARCLSIMTGCTFDAKTTSILCGRPINSVMFVQSIAKFPGSPPALLVHLLKQPFVRKNVPLKKMLLAHPNMPGDAKRST